jgi:serine/threonine protein kinase
VAATSLPGPSAPAKASWVTSYLKGRRLQRGVGVASQLPASTPRRHRLEKAPSVAMGCCSSKPPHKQGAEGGGGGAASQPRAAAAAAEKQEAVEDGRVVNQYVLVRQIGSGTFGKVFLARTQDGGPPGRAAVKQMDMVFLRKRMRRTMMGHGGQEGADEMVKREIATMKKLNHPNVCSLLDVIDDHDSSTMYVVTEFLAGGSMEARRQDFPGGAIPTGELRTYFRQMVCGLNYLHEVVNIAHRDIKPENIMLDHEDTVRIIDFGTAQIFTLNADGSASDFTAKAAGTPAFYAPEMCDAEIDEYEMLPTDIWALGVTLYQLAYGRLPFRQQGLMLLMEEIERNEVEFPPLPGEAQASDASLTELMRSMLIKAVRDPKLSEEEAAAKSGGAYRTSCAQIMLDPWVTDRDSLSFTSEQLSCEKISVSTEDVNASVTRLSTRLDSVSSIKVSGWPYEVFWGVIWAAAMIW